MCYEEEMQVHQPNLFLFDSRVAVQWEDMRQKQLVPAPIWKCSGWLQRAGERPCSLFSTTCSKDYRHQKKKKKKLN